MTALLIIVTAFAVYQILLHFGVFEFGVGFSESVEEVQRKKKLNQKRSFERKKLRLYYNVTDMFRGLIMSNYTKSGHQYFIDRLGIRSEILDRQLTPEELRGKYFLWVIVGVFVIPLGFFFPILWIVPVVALLRFIMYPFLLSQKIVDEDRIIDDYFLDLYLLMYSKLRLGSKASLQGVVESYIKTLETSDNLEMKRVMLRLSEYLLNNISMHPDHVAIPKLRDRYHSATIVNFCNVASQALQGVDNADNLLTFKVTLVRRKTNMMENRARKLCSLGEKSIYAIYVILFIFIGVGLYSKLPVGMF